MKVCTKCGIEKTADEFYKQGSGRQSHCKICDRARCKKWRDVNPERHLASVRNWQEANREKYKDNQRAWTAANAERIASKRRENYAAAIEEKREVARQWRADNPDKIREYGRSKRTKPAHKEKKRAWAAANPDKVRAGIRAWRAANRETVYAQITHRRAAKLAAIPQWEREAIARETAWRKQNPGMSLDHIVPISPPLAATLGGRPLNAEARKRFVGPLIPLVYGFHTEANWQPLTRAENSRKGNREWPHAPWHEN
jgi:hypothetical protein